MKHALIRQIGQTIICAIATICLTSCAQVAGRQAECPVDHIPLQRRIVYFTGPNTEVDFGFSDVWRAFAESSKLDTPESKFPYATPPFLPLECSELYSQKGTILFCPECDKRMRKAFKAFELKWKAEQRRKTHPST